MTFDVVVPTVGRDSLGRLLDALAAGSGPLPGRVLLVDDREDRSRPLLATGVPPGRLGGRVEVVPGRAAGPAAARNLGWRRATAGWVAFLDDDVVPSATWLADLAADLDGLGPDVAASQGRIVVPMPAGRRPTDWERNVRGLETARWATADMAYRREVLERVGGFDERFPRAYREDADLGLRVVGAGYRIVGGRRVVSHPVRRAPRLVSVRLQAGNADDVLMRGLHGSGWRERAGVPGGRRPRHLLVTGLGLLGVGAGLLARRGCPPGGLALPPGTTVGRAETALRSPTSRGGARRGRWARRGRRARWVAGLAGLGWLAGTGELALARIGPGPRTVDEVATMAVTSVLLPPVATWHWLLGWVRLPRLLAEGTPAPRPVGHPAASAGSTSDPTSRMTRQSSGPTPTAARSPASTTSPASGRPASPGPAFPGVLASVASFRGVPKAVLLDRDGTLVVDVPYNGDPERVVVMPGAWEAVERLRAAGVLTAVVSNQSGVARGYVGVEQVEAVNRRVEELLGPLGPWLYCVHGPWEGCGCRKPAPGLIEAAAGALGVEPAECVVIGDVGSDVEAARAAGAGAVLVPTAVTRAEEVAAAPVVAPDLLAAVELLLGPGDGEGRR
jgi:histidinol-phosphate phosphatase family protein